MNYKCYKNVHIFATHGHARQEKELGQKFVLEITLFGADARALFSADLDPVVEDLVQQEGMDVHRDMIQAVSGRIGNALLQAAPESIQEVRVEVKKPSTPVRIGMPGGLVKYVSTTVSFRQPGYQPVYLPIEHFNFTKIRSARVFDRQLRIEADVDVAFPMEDSIENDDITYSYSYTDIYDAAVETIRAHREAGAGEMAGQILERVFAERADVQVAQATVRNYLPENGLSADCMEYRVRRRGNR